MIDSKKLKKGDKVFSFSDNLHIMLEYEYLGNDTFFSTTYNRKTNNIALDEFFYTQEEAFVVCVMQEIDILDDNILFCQEKIANYEKRKSKIIEENKELVEKFPEHFL